MFLNTFIFQWLQSIHRFTAQIRKPNLQKFLFEFTLVPTHRGIC